MAKKIKIKLTQKSFQEAIAKINEYKQDILSACTMFVSELAKHGVEVAILSTKGNYLGRFVAFYFKLEPNPHGAEAIVVGTNRNGLLTRRWMSLDELGHEVIKSADVSPLLMVEFGAGAKAKNPMNVPNVGRGTFPEQTHAFEDSWWWKDTNGGWHETSGETASLPMYTAYTEMYSLVSEYAKRCFREVKKL